jgi:hypothetical protein
MMNWSCGRESERLGLRLCFLSPLKAYWAEGAEEHTWVQSHAIYRYTGLMTLILGLYSL